MAVVVVVAAAAASFSVVCLRRRYHRCGWETEVLEYEMENMAYEEAMSSTHKISKDY